MSASAKHRFFADDVSGDLVELPDDEARHARDVLRLSGGETVEVFDGAGAAVIGGFACASADNSPRRKAGVRASVRVVERRQTRRPEPTIELAFAVAKGKRLDWLLEKAAELGAARLAPVAFERSVVRPDLSAHARRRWRGILIAACKQCGSDWLPQIAAPAALADYLAGDFDGTSLLGDAGEGVSVPEALGGLTPRSRGGPFQAQTTAPAGRRGLDEASSLPGVEQPTGREGTPGATECGGDPAPWAVSPSPRVSPVRILVGPEGGLTDAERAAALAAGFVPVRLGRNVLRVETAAVAMLAAVTACAAT